MRFLEIVKDFIKTYPLLNAANLAMAMTLTPVHDVLLPHLYGRLVSTIEKGGAYTLPMTLVLVTVAFVQFCSFLKDALDMETQPRLFDFVRSRMMISLLNKYDGNLVEPPNGAVISTVIRSPEIIAWWVECSIDVCIPYLFAFTTAAVYFYCYDLYIALALLLLLTGLVTLLICAPIRCMRESIAREQALQDCHEQIDDTLRNVASVYASNTLDLEIDLMGVKGRAYQVAHKTAMKCMLVYKGIGVPIVVAFFCIVVIRCCQLVTTKRITRGTFVSLFMVTTSLVNTLAWMVSLVKSATLDSGTLYDSQMICTRAREDVRPHIYMNPVFEDPSRDGIRFQNVTYRHAGQVGVPIVRDFTYNFERHQRTLITGPVGSGKSTLLKLMLGFLTPDDGDILQSGVSYKDLGIQGVRSDIAFMPQESTLFDRTVLDNILYGNRAKTERDVLEMLEVLDMQEAFAALADGLRTKCEKGGLGLSGGQRQLVYFMRVVLRDPQYIILDEPTASMDAFTKHVLMRALDLVSRSKTVIMITHDKDLMSFATRRLEWPPASKHLGNSLA